MKKMLAAIISAILMLSIASCGTQTGDSSGSGDTEQAITLRLGHKMTADSLDGQAFQMFADLVEEKTNGSVKIEVFPASQLSDGSTQVNNVILGAQDLYAESLSEWSGITKTVDIANVPYLFNSNEQYFEVVRGEFGARQAEELENGGVKLLNTERNWIRGPYRVICSTVPITSMEDFSGLRLRTWEAAAYMECWSALGANPLVIGWNDTYLSLSQGTVQAVTAPASQVETMAFYEVAPYITNINEFPQEIGIVMNRAKFDSLSAEQQQALFDAANEAGEWASSAVYDYVEESFARMEEAGATFYEMDTASCTEMLIPVYERLVSEGSLPEGLLESLGLV